MYRHARKKDEVTELTAADFRAILLNSLNKLSNRDTVKNGFDELVAIIPDLSLEDESLPIFMNCLLENGEKQIAAYKKETFRIIASCASVHQDNIQSFLARIISNAVKYIKDKDTSVRDTVAESLGMICRCTALPPEIKSNNPEGAFLGLYLKPMFQLLGEHNKGYQVAAAMCITAVLKNTSEHEVSSHLTRLVARFQKCLTQPSCLARAALLGCVTALVEVSRLDAIPFVPTVIALLIDGFNSSEWDARKAAAEGFQKLAVALKEAISPYKKEVLDVLERFKFDKIKPVRDAVAEAIDLYHTLPGSGNSPEEPSAPSTPKTSGTLGRTFNKSATMRDFRSKAATLNGVPPAFENAMASTLRADQSKENRAKTIAKLKQSITVPHTIYVPPPPKGSTVSDELPPEGEQPEEEVPAEVEPDDVPPTTKVDNYIDSEREREDDFQVQEEKPQSGTTEERPRLSRANTTPNFKMDPAVAAVKSNVQRTAPKAVNTSTRESRSSSITSSQSLSAVEPRLSTRGRSSTDPVRPQIPPVVKQSQNDEFPVESVDTTMTVEEFEEPAPVFKQPLIKPDAKSTQVQLDNIMEQLTRISDQYNKVMSMFQEFALNTRQEMMNVNARLEKLEGSVLQIQQQQREYKESQQQQKTEAPAPILPPPTSQVAPIVIQTPQIVPTISESNDAWTSAMDNVSVGHLDGAYARILKEGDALQLIRLIQKTGPCLDRLEPTTATTLFGRFTVFLRTNSFVENVFPWLHQAVERNMIPLSQTQLKHLVRALADLAASPSTQGIEAAKLEAEIKKMTN